MGFASASRLVTAAALAIVAVCRVGVAAAQDKAGSDKLLLLEFKYRNADFQTVLRRADERAPAEAVVVAHLIEHA